MTYKAPSRSTPESHQRNAEKLSRIPIKVEASENPLRKPEWIRVKVPLGSEITHIKKLLRDHDLHTVCEEAACPNLAECFSHGTATFMILGDLCTRRCPFCDVAHGKPLPPDPKEPEKLAKSIASLNLQYVVITSVNRDDLRDGGASHFAECIAAIRQRTATTKVEILVPDFRGRETKAIEILSQQPCDVFNHNLETVPRLYSKARPGADYHGSLQLLEDYRSASPGTPTKSGLMLGIGETFTEVQTVMQDLLDNGCTMLTIGQYLPPSKAHLPVERYVAPQEFEHLANIARSMGFHQVASAPLVRSSYHADQQAKSVISDYTD